MGAKADHDLWGQVLAIENRYGDRGPEVLTRRIEKLREAGELAEAAFWAEVATCLNDLHSIRFGVPATKARSGSASPGDRGARTPILSEGSAARES
jgi:hypothetical protein